ncbi:MAG: right-handed parallel beta-helix repeat-containing protein [Gemmataceae bacterium]|nr:right-handed parallel beta-helix repeat-containing protein [Gemmataceae bacterium]
MTDVRDFGAKGDGVTDDTAALTHAIQRGDGHLVFSRGDYVLSAPLHVPLALHGRIAIQGAGGAAKIVMTGPGPAFHLVGSHRRSALPAHFEEDVWQKERLPTLSDLEIEGRHPKADGVRIEGVMQPTLRGLLIRRVRHGIHLANRDRNVLVADCHIYNNSGIGIFLERVNLHQTNIHGNHISYNQRGGIAVVGSEIRNIQICSNDIEYNHDLKADASADVLFDCRDGTVREGTLVGNTIQAVQTPGGANVRFLGHADHPNAVGLFAITGNLIGSQTRALDLHGCRGVVVSGNSIYSGYRQAIWAERCEHLVIGVNSIDHNPEYQGASTDQLVFRNCRNLSLTGLIVQHTRPAADPVGASIEMRDCQDVNVTGVQILNARTSGILLDNCTTARVADCTIRGPADDASFRRALNVGANCRQVMVTNNFFGNGSEAVLPLPPNTGVESGNVMI